MTDTTDPQGDVAAALDAARDNLNIIDNAAAASAVALRDDMSVQIVDLEQYLLQPVRQQGTIEALTASGFVDATRRLQSGPESTSPAIVYADVDAIRLDAILNDDQGTQPGWRDMRVSFKPQHTPEWNHWINNQGLVEQDKFAAVIEGGETDIREPTATVMLEMAQTFNASSSAKFKQAGRLRDGRQQLVYEEEIDATAGEGLVAIPDTFTVELRPFYGAAPVLVPCKLRYRIDRGDLRIGYSIHRPEEIVRTSFQQDVIAAVVEAGLTVLEAIPAGPR